MTTILTWLAGSHVVQGIIVGGVLAFLTAQIIMNAVVKAMTTTVNGWSTTFKCGQPGNGILLRAACARNLPAVNVAQEAAYWTTTVDSAGRRLSGQREYVLHFPEGQLPPNDAFWSLTMTDVVGYMVSNPIDRSSVGSRSGLVPNADGSIDILSTAHGSRWARVQLAAGTGRLLQADAPRVSARSCGPGRRVPRAASHESAMR